MVEALVGLIGAGLIGVGGWAFSKVNGLDTRVAVLEADKVSLKELLDVKLAEITRRLDRIEQKLDHNAE